MDRSEIQDSLGTVSGTSGQSSSAKLGKAQVVSQMARLGAVYGKLKDRSPEMIELMAEEWCKALRCYPLATIEQAITNVIGHKKFWPVISEVVDACQAIEAAQQERRDAEERARRAAADANQILDPYEAFARGVLSFIRAKKSREEDFRQAGVSTIKGEVGLYFETVEAAHRMARLYGAELDDCLGYHVTMDVEPPPTATSKWVVPKWSKDLRA